ncbi:hypothetical protein DF143_37370 [Burkholderia cenocepacia]|nr:hypothetical protein DF143_37370 [Burkholderia cenocepacia]RQV31819.1 hypothetical protein DF033_36930 [Burkholderia cenocepacia]
MRGLDLTVATKRATFGAEVFFVLARCDAGGVIWGAILKMFCQADLDSKISVVDAEGAPMCFVKR